MPTDEQIAYAKAQVAAAVQYYPQPTHLYGRGELVEERLKPTSANKKLKDVNHFPKLPQKKVVRFLP